MIATLIDYRCISKINDVIVRPGMVCDQLDALEQFLTFLMSIGG